MPQLPPDPTRLRAILAHLDRQLAANETVGTTCGSSAVPYSRPWPAPSRGGRRN